MSHYSGQSYVSLQWPIVCLITVADHVSLQWPIVCIITVANNMSHYRGKSCLITGLIVCLTTVSIVGLITVANRMSQYSGQSYVSLQRSVVCLTDICTQKHSITVCALLQYKHNVLNCIVL